MNDSQAGPSRDPYQLDRLAEELATRERSFTQTDDEDDDEQHDLPVHVPLAHDNPFLTADAFDIEQFLLSRSHVSLPDLRTELRDYLSTLKEELVSLINNDYEAFISLSTDLRGEGARLNKLKAPLDGLRTQVQVRVSIACIPRSSQHKSRRQNQNYRSPRRQYNKSSRLAPFYAKKRYFSRHSEACS